MLSVCSIKSYGIPDFSGGYLRPRSTRRFRLLKAFDPVMGTQLACFRGCGTAPASPGTTGYVPLLAYFEGIFRKVPVILAECFNV
jgi:hypothetical protein